MELEGPYAGCCCGRHSGRLLTLESEPGYCGGCNVKMVKGCIWKTEGAFCVHCGNVFEIDAGMAFTTAKILGGEHLDVTCVRCKKITRIKPTLSFDLEAQPPLT